MQPILVTGGAGFIGGEFVRQRIAEEGTAVVNLDKLAYAGNLDSLASIASESRHLFMQGDIGDASLVRSLLETHRPRAIVNFAAESYGDGGRIRDRLFVADHCRAIREVLARGCVGEVYNVDGNCERKNLDVVRTICRAVDAVRPGLAHASCESLVTFVKDRPGRDRRYAIDFSKIRLEFGWSPRETFDTGIERTVRWYLDNSRWIQRVQSGGYRQERLGLGAG